MSLCSSKTAQVNGFARRLAVHRKITLLSLGLTANTLMGSVDRCWHRGAMGRRAPAALIEESSNEQRLVRDFTKIQIGGDPSGAQNALEPQS